MEKGVGFDLAMRTYDWYEASNPYEHEEYVMGKNVRMRNDETKCNGRIFQETPLDIASIMRSLIKA